MNTTTTADRAYFLARLIDVDGRTTPFHGAGGAVADRSRRLLDASVVLHPEREVEREQLRTATQDLLDLTALLTRRIEAAYETNAGTEQVVAAYATEYEAAVKGWQDAVDVVLGAGQVTA
jgi:hypothetical protein